MNAKTAAGEKGLAKAFAKGEKSKPIPNVVWRKGWAHAVVQIDGRQVWRSLRTRYAHVARQRSAEVVWKLQTGEMPLYKRRGGEDLRALLADYREKRGPDLRASTLASNVRRFTAFLDWAEARGIVRARQATTEAMIAYRAERVKLTSRMTAGTDLRAVSAVLAFGRSVGRVHHNPFVDMPSQPRIPRGEKTILPWATIERLLETSRADEFGLVTLVALFTGLRREELLHLRWTDVDRERALIHVVNRPGEFAVKTSEARSLPLGALLAERLAETPMARPDVPARLRGRPRLHVKDSARIAPTTAPDKLSDGVQSFLKRAGIAGGIHGLRHNWITMMLLGGAPVAQVMAWAGHSNLATTDGYTHVRQAVPREDVERFRRAMFGDPA